MYKTRNVKLILTDKDNKELKDYEDCYFNCLNDINKRLLKYVRNGWIFLHSGQRVISPNGMELTDSDFKNEHLRDLINKHCVKSKVDSHFRSIYHTVAQQYKGYDVRNKKKTNLIHFKRKNIHHKTDLLSVKNEKLYVTNIFGDDFELDFRHDVGCIKNLKYIQSNTGGNYNIKQGCFIIRASVPYNEKYTPKGYYGIDINKKNSNWIYCNTGFCFEKSEKISELEERIRIVNKDIKDKNSGIKTKKRRRLRIKWKKWHRQHRKLIQPIVNEIIDYVENNELCLCIDSVTSGQKNGTFGQDKIFKLLITECENRCVPFVVVPTYYTSRRCPECGHVSQKNRDQDNFSCINCFYNTHADYIGSINVQEFGQVLYENEYKGFITDKGIKNSMYSTLRNKFSLP